MKIALITILVFGSSSLFGQSKWELIGEFQYSIFMHTITLTLKDQVNYELVDRSDIGSRRTIGTWTIRGQAIRLTPKKTISDDVYNKV